MTESDAGSLRRDLMLLSMVIGLEMGRAAATGGTGLRRAQTSALARARSFARALPPVLVRPGVAGARGWFRVVEVVEVDRGAAGETGRDLAGWLGRVRAGVRFDAEQAPNYRFNQVYISRESGAGYWVLDSYGPISAARGAGPVSRKFTQLADVQISSAQAMLREAYRKYRPGRAFADVPSRPPDLPDKTIQCQLWLEVPVQIKPIQPEVLATANQLAIRIRDVTGRVF